MFCSKCGSGNPVEAKFCKYCGTALKTESPPSITSLPTAANQPIDARYAGFWRRGAALSLDCLVIFIINIFLVKFVIGFVVGFILRDKTEMFFQNYGDIVWGVASILYGWIYFASHESGKHSATFGKRIFHLKVTKTNGETISFARATWRYFCKSISFVTLLIGYFIQPFTAKRQALHDLLADSVVVQTQEGRRGWVIATNSFLPGIALIGIVVAVAIPAYQTFQKRTEEASIVKKMPVAPAPINEATSQPQQVPAASTPQPQETPAASTAPNISPDQSRSNIVQEMVQASRDAVSAYKEGGVSGMSIKTTDCYKNLDAHPFFCGYLDLAARRVDQGTSATLHLPLSEFFADAQFGERIVRVLNKANMNMDQGNNYLRTVTPEINKLVDAELSK